MMFADFSKYLKIQNIAKKVLDEIAVYINKNSTEASISRDCIKLLSKYGITETWYYNVLALVLLGSRSCLSMITQHFFCKLLKHCNPLKLNNDLLFPILRSVPSELHLQV